MWEATHKALLTSIYKQISYYSIASEYYPGFKAELDCHYNRWSLKIRGFFSILSFVLLRHPLTSTEFSASELAAVSSGSTLLLQH